MAEFYETTSLCMEKMSTCERIILLSLLSFYCKIFRSSFFWTHCIISNINMPWQTNT